MSILFYQRHEPLGRKHLDSSASTSTKTVPQLQETDMDNISNWCKHNKMVLNADKTK